LALQSFSMQSSMQLGRRGSFALIQRDLTNVLMELVQKESESISGFGSDLDLM